MAEKKSKSTSVVKLPQNLMQQLTPEQQNEVTEMLARGEEVVVVNGQLFKQTKVEKQEIEGWQKDETIVGVIVEVRESGQYKDNHLITFLTNDRKTVIKPLDTVLRTMLKPYISTPNCIYTIKCLGEIKGKRYSYNDFEVTVAAPVF